MLRDAVLTILKERGGYVYGAEISRELHVTRMAVSNAVRALRDEGYEIDAVTNRGYLLRESADRLTAGDVYPYLPPERRELVRCLESVDSTNTYLKREAMAGAAAPAAPSRGRRPRRPTRAAARSISSRASAPRTSSCSKTRCAPAAAIST